MTHNLVFALLKSGDYRYAKEIIEMESMAPYPDTLIEALADVSIQPYSPSGSSDKTVAMNSAKTTSASFVPAAPAIIEVGPVAKTL
ncbi:putative lipoprotein [Yersinia pseudotuberculosis]|nr:putative lipoprotein [Yersinia pseudotuberculosis]